MAARLRSRLRGEITIVFRRVGAREMPYRPMRYLAEPITYSHAHSHVCAHSTPDSPHHSNRSGSGTHRRWSGVAGPVALISLWLVLTFVVTTILGNQCAEPEGVVMLRRVPATVIMAGHITVSKSTTHWNMITARAVALT